MSELATRRPQSVAEHATVNYAKALQYLGLSEGDPKAHALLLVCQRYQLDPLLGHVDLYEGKPYIKYAGYIHIGNSNPHYEGAECVREWEDDTYCYATVRVHRDDRKFYAERTGKSRKVKKKKDGTKYEDDEADAKAFAQAHRRALRLSFNVDSPEPAEDEQQPAPAPVVEIARKMSDPPHDTLAPPGVGRGGSDPTSEGGGAAPDRAPESRVSSPSDPSSPPAQKGKLVGRGATSGEESSGSTADTPGDGPAVSSSPDPSSPTRPVSEQPGRVGGNLQGVGSAGSDPPRANGVPTADTGDPTGPAYPVEEWAIRQDPPVDLRVAKIALRKQFKEDFGWLKDWRDLQELQGEQAVNAITALEAIYLDPGEGKP